MSSAESVSVSLPFGFGDFPFERLGVNRAFVDIEQRDVVERDLMEKDDELYEVGVSLLPERFLAPPKRLFRSDAMLYASAYASRSLCSGL